MEEIWKMHPSGRMVSSLGRIEGLRVPFLSQTMQSNGYLRVHFNGKSTSVHRIVVETFIGEIPKDKCVNHKDGVKSNNNINNLEIVTPKENSQHAMEMGLCTVKRGEECPQSELTNEQILEIYELIKSGKSNTEIAEIFNMYSGHISSIRHGHRWNHLYEEFFKGQTVKSPGGCDLSFDERLDIVRRISETDIKNAELAREFNKDPSIFSYVRSRKIWKDIWNSFEKQAAM